MSKVRHAAGKQMLGGADLMKASVKTSQLLANGQSVKQANREGHPAQHDAALTFDDFTLSPPGNVFVFTNATFVQK